MIGAVEGLQITLTTPIGSQPFLFDNQQLNSRVPDFDSPSPVLQNHSF